MYDHTLPDRNLITSPVHTTLLAFPIACFSLTVLTDLAYWKTLNLLWLHVSEWLLFAGLVFGGVDLIVWLADLLFRRVRPSWLAVFAGMVVLLLAVLNSFIHTSDGWTAVVPWGLTLSVLTVLAMLVTSWVARGGARHV